MKRIILILLLILTVAACGRMSPPVAPKGTTYPQDYIVRE